MKKDFNNLNRETYNKISDQFSGTRKFVWKDIRSLLKYVKEGDKVLDLGCGTGRLYQLFKNVQAVEYLGLDNSEGQIKNAKENFPDGEFVLGEMTKLPFANDTFDIIFCIAAFHHLDNEEQRIQSLKEMQRVLKPGGVVAMTNWHMWSDWWEEKVKQGKYKQIKDQDFIVPWKNSKGEVLGDRYYHGFREQELIELLNKAGFEFVEQYLSKIVKWHDEKGGANLMTVAKAVK